MLYFSEVEFHPIIIIGAGPAGSTTALALAKKGKSCLLLDQSESSEYLEFLESLG